MGQNFSFKILTPSETVFEGVVESIVAPGASGHFGVLKNHAPFASSIKPGTLSIKDSEGLSKTFKVGEGFFEVRNNTAVFLTDEF